MAMCLNIENRKNNEFNWIFLMAKCKCLMCFMINRFIISKLPHFELRLLSTGYGNLSSTFFRLLPKNINEPLRNNNQYPKIHKTHCNLNRYML